MKINCGGAAARLDVGNDGIARADINGLLLPGAAWALAWTVLCEAKAKQAAGIVTHLSGAALALPPVLPGNYTSAPDGVRGLPVALVVAPEQMHTYAGLSGSAAQNGFIRRAFLCPVQAREWLAAEVALYEAQQAWREARLACLARQHKP